MIGKKLGQYEIVKPLGSGGMGDVYRALDTSLKREVALKVLPEAMAADGERLARLQREAQLLAAVNHPNIAAIYNLEESEGVRWLVLELVEGETLERRLRPGPLPVAEALSIARQVADALEAAHDKGIVHRDLKAANVMLDEKGRVKVLDFGIAKDLSGEAGGALWTDTDMATQAGQMAAQLTATGVIVGTVPYMSPEQIRGKGVDKRTDNWAFGCLLFELLTGRRPFDRETMADTLSAVLEHEPDWSLLPDETPEAVRTLLQRCLQKDPNTRLHAIAAARIAIGEIEATGTSARFGTATIGRARRAPAAGRETQIAGVVGVVAILIAIALIGPGWWSSLRDAELGATSAAAGLPAALAITPDVNPASVAVLPFTSFGGNADTEYFARGLAMAIHDDLQGVEGLTVPAASSSFRPTADEPAEIGRKLGVAMVLTGRIQFAEDTLQARVELVDVATGNVLQPIQQVWSLDDLDKIFAFQQEVAERVSEAVELELAGAEGLRPTESLAAYNAYLRGMEAMPRRTGPSLQAALGHFEDAVELDADFALAHQGVAMTYLLLQSYWNLDDDEAFDKAEQSARRALQLDPGLGGAEAVLALVAVGRGEGNARDLFERALELAPNDALVHQAYGNQIWMFGGGATQRAWEVWMRALELDPFGAAANENIGWLLFTEGRFDEARLQMERAIELEPAYPLGHMGLGVVLTYSGRAGDAIPELLDALRLNPENGDRHQVNLGLAYAALGRDHEAVSALRSRTLIDLSADARYLDLADVYRDVVGDLDQAALWYKEARDQRDASFERRGASGRVRPRTVHGQVVVELDRGNPDAAEAWIAAAEEESPRNEWTRYARLDIEMYHGRWAAGAAIARELAELEHVGGPARYGRNWKLYSNQYPVEPVGYFGAVAGEPQLSVRWFEVNFPALLGDDPPIHAFTLKPAVDLAAVLMRTGDEDRADLLLERAEAYIDGLPDAQRRNQFRLVPAQIYALQGRADDAFAAMDLAFDAGWRSGWWRLPYKPHFDAIRDDPRFQAMIDKLRAAAAG